MSENKIYREYRKGSNRYFLSEDHSELICRNEDSSHDDYKINQYKLVQHLKESLIARNALFKGYVVRRGNEFEEITKEQYLLIKNRGTQ